MTPLLQSKVPWAPFPKAAPRTAHTGDDLVVEANGTRTCVGGWQVAFSGVAAGTAYRVEVPFVLHDLRLPDDLEHVKALVFWGPISEQQDVPVPLTAHDALLLVPSETGPALLARDLVAPEGTSSLTVRLTFRWSARGRVVFGTPKISPIPAPKKRRMRVSVATGSIERRQKAAAKCVADNVAYYLALCEEACRERPDFIVLPETALHWGTLTPPEDPYADALALSAPEVAQFGELAGRHAVRILVGLHERDGDATFNSAALVGPGGCEGVYHKVHLAECGETHSGLLPGNAFPVFSTPAGRVGCLICMDSSSAEASRMIGLNGADVLFLPIMGDHRADRFTMGQPVFHEERWKAIMRTRALDNQICLAVARNETLGSCLIDQRGEFLAYNDGTRDVITAEFDLDPGWRKWNGGSQRDIVWLQRRPQLYAAFTAAQPEAVKTLSGFPARPFD